MKMKLALSRGRKALALAATLITLGSAPTVCKAGAFDSPVGTWDFVTSGGGQEGIAYLTFAPDNTFSGFVLHSGKHKSGSSGTVGRDGTILPTRGDAPTITPDSNTALIGFPS